MKRLLLLGGGHAHVHVLREFARQPPAATQLMMVTPYARQMYSGMVPGLVAGHYAVDACAIALKPLADAAKVSFVEAGAVSVDAARRTVTLSDGRVAGYDLLSLDVGSVMQRDAIAGAREHGLFVRPIESFVALLAPLWELAATRALDIGVIGGGAAGFELALALQHRLGGGSRADSQTSSNQAPARIALVTGGGRPLQGYPQAVIDRADRVLRQRRITVLPEVCTAITAGYLHLANGARVACDAPVLALPSSAAPWLADSGLALDGRGYVRTTATLQSASHPEVFAAGDIATRDDAPHVKSGVYAVRAGPPLAANLRAALAGAALVAHTPQSRTLNLLACGRREAIASWGDWSAQGRWVWWWKDRIDRGFIARYRNA